MIKIPREVPVMTLSGVVLFPHSLLPLHIFENRYQQMLTHCLDGERMFAVVLTREGVDEPGAVEDVCPIAGIGLIRACVGADDGTSNLVLQGLARIKLLDWVQETPFRIARIELVQTSLENAVEADALCAKVKELCNRLKELEVPLPANLVDQMQQIDEPDVLADVVAAAFVVEPILRQELLETVSVPDRLRRLIQFLRTQTEQ